VKHEQQMLIPPIGEPGSELAEPFALPWPRAVHARRCSPESIVIPRTP